MLEMKKPKKKCGRNKKAKANKVEENRQKKSGADVISRENDELQSVEEEGETFIIKK